MEITVNEKIKVAEIWLTNEEQDDTQILEEVGRTIQKYKKIKYKTVIFHSGKCDLEICTENLLKNNLQ